MKTLLLLATLLFSLPLFADLRIELTLDKSEAVTGERVNVRVRVTNTATVAVAARITVGPTEHPEVEIRYTSVPPGWECFGTSNCFNPAFAANSTVEFIGSFVTPTRAVPNFRLHAGVQGGGDTDPSNSNVFVQLPVTAASRRADLAVDSAPVVHAAHGTDISIVLTVRNAGPDAAENVTATIGFGWTAPGTSTIAGEGWTCANLVCTRPSLAANSAAPIMVSFKTSAEDAFTTLLTRVYAEKNLDQSGAGLLVSIYTGDRGDWRMRLVPVPLEPVNGANNARWTTDLTMLIRADREVEIEPDGCEPGAPECTFTGTPPLREPFDPRRPWPASFVGGHYVWVRAADFDAVRFNARVYDANRQAETAGAELPLPRGEQFSTETIALLNIPVAPQFRHTLRIYDDNAHDGAQVLIRIYADSEIEPRAVLTQVLRSKDPALRVSHARLPLYPAMAELQLAQLMLLEGIDSLRVEVQPVSAGVRIWSFVSITNNDTHHVTTVTPQ